MQTYKRAEVKKVLVKNRGLQVYASAWRTYRLDSDNPQEVLRLIAERAGKWYLRRREVAARQINKTLAAALIEQKMHERRVSRRLV